MKTCLLCDSNTERDSWRSFFGWDSSPLCEKCLGALQLIEGNRCPECSRPMAESRVCRDCVAWEKSLFKSNFSIYIYNEAMQSLIARFKYRGDYILASVFAGHIQKAARKAQCDVICAVPLSPSRLTERRFNQSEAIIEQAGLSHVPLIARRESGKQSKKTRAERVETEQTFYPINSAAGKSVLLIDDIYTTGATIRLAADALKKAGATSVKSVTIARSGHTN